MRDRNLPRRKKILTRLAFASLLGSTSAQVADAALRLYQVSRLQAASISISLSSLLLSSLSLLLLSSLSHNCTLVPLLVSYRLVYLGGNNAMPPVRPARLSPPRGWNGIRPSVYRRNDDYGDTSLPQHPHYERDLGRGLDIRSRRRSSTPDSERVNIRPRGYQIPTIFSELIGTPAPIVAATANSQLGDIQDPLFPIFTTVLQGARCLPRSGSLYARFLNLYSDRELYQRLRSEAVVPWEALQRGGDETELRRLAGHRYEIDTNGAG